MLLNRLLQYVYDQCNKTLPDSHSLAKTKCAFRATHWTFHLKHVTTCAQNNIHLQKCCNRHVFFHGMEVDF